MIIDLLMGLFRGAVLGHDGGARKQRIKQPTEMPTSTMALMGRFPSLMGPFSDLNGAFPKFRPKGPFCLSQTKKNSSSHRAILRRTFSEVCGGFWGEFSEVARSFSEVAFTCGNHRTQRILGQVLRSLLQNPENFSKVASEVRPAVHTAPLCLRVPKSLFMCFCTGRVIPNEGENAHKQDTPPQIPARSREHFVFFLVCFFFGGAPIVFKAHCKIVRFPGITLRNS